MGKALDVGTQVNRFFKDRNTAMFLEITGTHAAQLEGMNFDIATSLQPSAASRISIRRCAMPRKRLIKKFTAKPK